MVLNQGLTSLAVLDLIDDALEASIVVLLDTGYLCFELFLQVLYRILYVL